MSIRPQSYVSREAVLDWINGAGYGDDFYVVTLELLSLIPHRLERDRLMELLTHVPHDVKVTLLLQLQRDLGNKRGDVVVGHEEEPKTET